AYHEDNRSFLEVWWDKFLDRLEDIFPSYVPSNGFFNIVLFLVIAAVMLLVVLVVFHKVRQRKRSTIVHENAPLKNEMNREFSYKNHLIQSRTTEANENYTEATRHLFLAVLLYFHENDLLAAGAGKTNFEYVTEIKQVNKQYASMFHHLAITFDEVVYGERMIQSV